jgi:magnesium chelatase family protein
MSLCLVQSRALVGLEAASVTVEVHLANGLPTFMLVGLVDTEVKEARVWPKMQGERRTPYGSIT